MSGRWVARPPVAAFNVAYHRPPNRRPLVTRPPSHRATRRENVSWCATASGPGVDPHVTSTFPAKHESHDGVTLHSSPVDWTSGASPQRHLWGGPVGSPALPSPADWSLVSSRRVRPPVHPGTVRRSCPPAPTPVRDSRSRKRRRRLCAATVCWLADACGRSVDADVSLVKGCWVDILYFPRLVHSSRPPGLCCRPP